MDSNGQPPRDHAVVESESNGRSTAARRAGPIAAFVMLAAILAVPGCAAYHWGSPSLFYTHVRTIHVPIFESDSYRRNLGEWLTEAVAKEIELRTPYKVVHDPAADSVLRGRIVSERKYTISEDFNDNPRNVGVDLVAEIKWIDRAGNTMLRSATVPIDLTLAGSSNFTAEGGQSMLTTQQAVIRQAARQIVSQLEAGW
ncbi:MAG: hypothetical protein FJ297_14010 [Planctomycetes bacterium]|nr:hypothetical protein [Planctomycetota bacterium]